jgi:2'-5' RNA ligase
VEADAKLVALAAAVEAALAPLGIAREERAFTPHLTLARVPREVNPRERRALGEWFGRQPPPAAQTMRVTQVHLIQSELLPGGPKYTTLYVAGLSAAANGE